MTIPRKTFCVAVMSSSLCSVKLGWMLSFCAARSTCCPDTVTDSNRDDISMYKTLSSVSRICLEVTCWHVTFTDLYLKLYKLNILFLTSTNSILYIPGGHCCHVLSSFSHSLSCSFQLAELFRFLYIVTHEHQVT